MKQFVLATSILFFAVACNSVEHVPPEFTKLTLSGGANWPGELAFGASMTVDVESQTVSAESWDRTKAIDCEGNRALSVDEIQRLKAAVGEVTFELNDSEQTLYDAPVRMLKIDDIHYWFYKDNCGKGARILTGNTASLLDHLKILFPGTNATECAPVVSYLFGS